MPNKQDNNVDWIRELGWKHKEACASGRSCVCEIGYVADLLTSSYEKGVRDERERVATNLKDVITKIYDDQWQQHEAIWDFMEALKNN